MAWQPICQGGSPKEDKDLVREKLHQVNHHLWCVKKVWGIVYHKNKLAVIFYVSPCN